MGWAFVMTMMYLSSHVSIRFRVARGAAHTQSQLDHAEDASNARDPLGAQQLAIVKADVT
jgi:hypothetical protein